MMKSTEVQQQFQILRAQGRSFAKISEEIGVSKTTLIEWSRRFQFEISNLRAIEADALCERYLASREEQLRFLTESLKRVEAQISQTDLASLPANHLFALAASLRKEITARIEGIRFSCAGRTIPNEEYVSHIVEWKA